MTRIFFIALTLAVFSSCSSKKTNNQELDANNEKIEDFNKFYDRFISDSRFQMSRLKFPLGGHDDNGREWTQSNWHLMKKKVFDVDTSKFKVEIKKTDTEFFYRIWIPDSGFSTETSFKLIDGKWYLVSD